MKGIFIRLEEDTKEKLTAKAKALGLSLTSFIRMVLIAETNKNGEGK